MASNPTRWQKRWTMERSRGLKRMVSTATALAHIEWLIGQGFNCTAISVAAGVDRGTILNIKSGKNSLVKRTTEKKILAVMPETIYARPDRRGYVPAVGAVRRIRALMTMGWRYRDLSPRLGFPAEKVGEGAGWIGRHKHEAIVKLYDELWDTPGPAAKGSIKKLLNRGWHKPMAWDDDTIDDPAAEPYGTRRAA